MIAENLTVHCLICNEERWIWYALRSALPFCSRLILWDTGSTDRTIDIIGQVKSRKISFRSVGLVDSNAITELRNEMIRETETEWFAIVDGDEVWAPALWLEIADIRQDTQAEIIVCPLCYPFPRLGYFSATNDDNFQIAGKKGSYSAKAFRRTKGIHWKGSYGSEEVLFDSGSVISRGDYPGMRMVTTPIWHMTMLERSSLDGETLGRSGKLSIDDPQDVDLIKVSQLTDIPEVFYLDRPSSVMNPFLAECQQLRNKVPFPHPGCELL
ncbi:MAG: glycosyltransferase [Chloracidobacterium sp.]|nr:glycosyltransferase [Chloracidobacterium sp.]